MGINNTNNSNKTWLGYFTTGRIALTNTIKFIGRVPAFLLTLAILNGLKVKAPLDTSLSDGLVAKDKIKNISNRIFGDGTKLDTLLKTAISSALAETINDLFSEQKSVNYKWFAVDPKASFFKRKGLEMVSLFSTFGALFASALGIKTAFKIICMPIGVQYDMDITAELKIAAMYITAFITVKKFPNWIAGVAVNGGQPEDMSNKTFNNLESALDYIIPTVSNAYKQSLTAAANNLDKTSAQVTYMLNNAKATAEDSIEYIVNKIANIDFPSTENEIMLGGSDNSEIRAAKLGC